MPSGMKPDEMIQYGFKRISPTNLLQPDNHPSHPSRLRGERWVRACLKPQLESCVPEEIAFLFEVARGAMVYGMYFQPLAALTSEQCYRVLEAGARGRCSQLGLLKGKRSKDKGLQDVGFAELLKALTKAGKIPKADLEAWSTMPYLRNRYSHPTAQTIVSLESAVGVLAFTSELLNRLFMNVEESRCKS